MRILHYILIIGLFTAFMGSCKKDDTTPNYNADKTVLKSTLDSLNIVSANAVEGNKPGQYTPGAKASLDSVINLGE